MRKYRAVAVVVVMPLVLLGFAGASQAQLVLYDDFNTKAINPAKWFGTERSLGGVSPNTEASRKLSGGHLEIDLTSYGRSDSNSGTAGEANEALRTTNPAAITTTFQVDVAVKSISAVDCPANSASTFTSALVIGAWFNDGTSPNPGGGDRTGDVNGGIEKAKSSKLGDYIAAFITRCTNASCTTRDSIGFHTFATALTKGAFDTLRIQWDQPNHRFIFWVNQEQAVLGYVFPDANPAVLNFKNIGIESFASNCMLPNQRTVASAKVLFDNVMVNP